ncbi:nucleobase:cation symporter-2 family protein [Aciduricibacillus chroicocephali]|uniref:Nucleobase:cation symporter-2 family protein n=1 Tax=Aciduricibacillus chroicocephali TaxID=3054939 RepID=A0ABY9KSX7_9BACI|nr:nucleobase:cation symporter-2 family protein [Bacillaceae bacterium 44XB]
MSNSRVDEKFGFGKSTVLGMQHVAVMYGGAVAVPILIAGALGLTQEQLVYLISFDLFTCGIVSLIQTLGIGNFVGAKLPALMAISFVVVGPAISIGTGHGGGTEGLTYILGGVIGAGVLITVLSQFATQLVRFFPPIVTGSVVLVIGITLMPVAMRNAAGGSAENFGAWQHLTAAAFTFGVFLLLNHYAKGFVKSCAILLSLVIGTIFASFIGLVDPSGLKDASWFSLPQPFYFGVPKFDIAAILTMTLVGIIIMVESTGVFFALGEVSGKRIDGEIIKKGLRAEGIGGIISGIFNSFNHSTFSQNVGLVFLTKVVSRYVVAFGGGILVLLGLVPKIAAVTTMIPSAVLGGAMVPMFGMLMAASMQMMAKDDLTKASNQLIIGVGIGLALACAGASDETFKSLPQLAAMLIGTGPVVAGVGCFLLNWWLNGANYDPVAEYEASEENNAKESTA